MFLSNVSDVTYMKRCRRNSSLSRWKGRRDLPVHPSRLPPPHPTPSHRFRQMELRKDKALTQGVGVRNNCKSGFLTSCPSGHFFLNVTFSLFFFLPSPFFNGRVFKRLFDFKEKRQEEYNFLSRI